MLAHVLITPERQHRGRFREDSLDTLEHTGETSSISDNTTNLRANLQFGTLYEITGDEYSVCLLK